MSCLSYLSYKTLRDVLRPDGLCIMHLGVVKGRDMGQLIRPLAGREGFDVLALIYENVEECERHGVRDQGSTGEHEFMFLRRA